ncbi:Transmembrane protein 208 [Caligus rogercresseyi]|uniref:Transmembrane protein 208 n=1 Tax=Caligus rogercresseyi TaxID=217165 RepID=A0A7T8JV39_CALRO|nr:Transmembrane protein 208 [Caligus rogercresseyi]
MEEFAKKKGKEGTRGSKQIVKENAETIQFYRNIILGSNGLYFLVMTLLGASYSLTEILLFILSSTLYIGATSSFLLRLPHASENGAVLDTGLDLNITSGVSEHVKDLIILVAFSQFFWMLLLFIPGRGAWMLWKNFISPWLFAPGQPEGDDKTQAESKKAKKMERK